MHPSNFKQQDLKRILRQEAAQIAERAVVDVSWVSAKKMRRLNKEYRQVDVPTDVLSFPVLSYHELQKEIRNQKSEIRKKNQNEEIVPLHLGSLVLCLEVIHQRAKEAKQTVEEYTEWAIKHGLKHLLGYDHDETGQIWTPIR